MKKEPSKISKIKKCVTLNGLIVCKITNKNISAVRDRVGGGPFFFNKEEAKKAKTKGYSIKEFKLFIFK